MSRITINGVSLDPQLESPELKTRSLLATTSSGSDYILVQTQAPLDQAQKAALAATGAELLEYVPESTYLCHYNARSLAQIRA
jgi:serine protease AprX